MARKTNQMTDETQAQDAPATEGKKTRASFVRGPQKVWAILKVKDAEGNEVDVRAGKGYTVELSLSKDQSGVIKMLLDGATAFVTELEVPKAAASADDEAE